MKTDMFHIIIFGLTLALFVTVIVLCAEFLSVTYVTKKRRAF